MAIAVEQLLRRSPGSAGPNGSTLSDDGKSVRSFFSEARYDPMKKIEMCPFIFYVACTAGGILSCGLTNMAVTPLYLVKCNMPVSPFVLKIDPAKHKNILSGSIVLLKEQGCRG